ncbi:MAG: FAD:protein FMN transferase [Pseudomonadota bacterium]
MLSQNFKRREFLKAGLIGTAGLLAAPAFVHAGNPVQQLGGSAFGTNWRVLLGGEADAAQARAMIKDVIAQIDRSMSPYRKDSEISALNNGRAGRHHRVSADMETVLATAGQIAQQSDGAFDPGVGPIVQRFGFGPIKGDYVPFLQGIEQRGANVTKLDGKATIDLCGIAKGFAIDRIWSQLHAMGARDALIEIGGEFAALGTHPSGRDWRVAVENPQLGIDQAISAVSLGGRALATSGHRHQGVSGSIAVTHIIAPDQEKPANQQVLSASVLADAAMNADAWSTTLCALQPDAAISLAQRTKLDALIVTAAKVDLPAKAVRTGQFSRQEVRS